MHQRIDLHTHSTVSDGTLTPTELMRAAKAAGLAAIALTDHDTFEGLAEARAEAEKQNIEMVPGCELSLDFNGLPTHLLALFVDERPGHVVHELLRVRKARAARNLTMLEKLKTVGVHLKLEDVESHATGVVGRPHMAQAMLKAGVVRTFEEAFARFLGSGGLAYVPKAKLTPVEAIGAIHADGGLAVLAHPYLLSQQPRQLEAMLTELTGMGLDGVEVYYTEHSDKYTALVADLAQRLGLLMSGGSDFHGAVKPGVSLGRGRGGLFVRGELLDKMKQALQQRQPRSY
ncbi:MAG: PHP domain-containing protein [Humidesulfovibrio sp.]|uniref:PHP domain-containing protein n=1 Tax=Humidesulfovibrio sp. TaxID=2910988 RepID=UPI002733995C|nr:PHP domain-containing protein [Humidesulfovibrio sp.]MDP2848550.1 PHP domain-containing protein [Humidesulfovibrio sp.]